MTTQTERNYSPRAGDDEKPCGEQIGTWPGVRRHNRAAERARKAGVSLPDGHALAECPLCTQANRQHSAEMYAARQARAKS